MAEPEGTSEELAGMKIRPLQDRILVKRVDEEEKTAGGIIIPDSAKEKPQEGIVQAISRSHLLTRAALEQTAAGAAAGQELDVEQPEPIRHARLGVEHAQIVVGRQRVGEGISDLAPADDDDLHYGMSKK